MLLAENNAANAIEIINLIEKAIANPANEYVKTRFSKAVWDEKVKTTNNLLEEAKELIATIPTETDAQVGHYKKIQDKALELLTSLTASYVEISYNAEDNMAVTIRKCWAIVIDAGKAAAEHKGGLDDLKAKHNAAMLKQQQEHDEVVSKAKEQKKKLRAAEEKNKSLEDKTAELNAAMRRIQQLELALANSEKRERQQANALAESVHSAVSVGALDVNKIDKGYALTFFGSRATTGTASPSTITNGAQLNNGNSNSRVTTVDDDDLSTDDTQVPRK